MLAALSAIGGEFIARGLKIDIALLACYAVGTALISVGGGNVESRKHIT